MPEKESHRANRPKEANYDPRGKGAPQLQKCPACKEMTLYWDKCTNQGVCLSPGCKLSTR